MPVAVTPQEPHDEPATSADAAQRPGKHRGDVPDRLLALSHELRSMLDGSLRWLSLAARGLPMIESGPERDEIERTRKQLERVRESLMHMAELVAAAGNHEATTSQSKSRHRALVASVTMREAIDHAVAVIRPEAAEIGVTIGIAADDTVAKQPADAMYSIILNGLRNAIESIAHATGGHPGEGTIRVALRLIHRGGAPLAELTITDDGAGPPSPAKGRSVFDIGYSTRASTTESRGLGLSFCRSIVGEIGGSIELLQGRGQKPERPGAVLRATWPIQTDLLTPGELNR